MPRRSPSPAERENRNSTHYLSAYGGATRRHSHLNHSSFVGADLRFAALSDSECEGADFSSAKLFGASLWGIKYGRIKSDSIDISPEGDGSVLTNDVRLAPIAHLLSDDRLADIVHVLKLRTVVILGKDSSPEDLALLKRIADLAAQRELIPILVKEQREIDGEPFLKKALMYSLLARFIIVENSAPSGAIVELPKALSDGCVVAALQRQGRGSTWLLEEEFVKYRTVQRFWYHDDNAFDDECGRAFEWCEQLSDELAQRYRETYDRLNLRYLESTPGAS